MLVSDDTIEYTFFPHIIMYFHLGVNTSHILVLPDELKMLDRGFFEEVEDLKYALQQAARLNSAYEKALRQLCSQYGLSFPKVTTTTPTQRRRKRTRSQAREFTSQ